MQVVLIGEEFAGSENLALAMLEAALLARGHRVWQVAMGGLLDLEATAAEALACRPDLIGLSINYQLTALTALALGHRLRSAGYTGHLTAGGEFATIHPDESLRDCPLDSLCRFDGEQPLGDLADALERGGAGLEAIPGLVLSPTRSPSPHLSRGERRSGSATPARVWDRPFPYWAARRPPQPQHLGIPSAAILGSRGCSYHCVYCCISSLNRTASRQAREAGHLDDWVATRQRPVDDLAEEMAHLRRAHGVRLFRFEDDCLLGRSPEEAAPILDGLRRELARRRVDDIALTLKLRPDSLNRGVVGRLASLGLIHAFIGVEALTDGTLKRLGRSYRSTAAREALDALRENGVPAYFNALIIGPDTTLEVLAADLDALEGVVDFPLEVVRLILYDGTPMFRRLEARGAVHGNYLHWRYDFEDPGVEAVARVLARLPTRRTGAYCVAKRLADVEFNVAVARRFYPHVDVRAMTAELNRLKRASNRDAIAVVRRLIDFAAGRPSVADQLALALALGDEVGARDAEVSRRIDDLVTRLEEAASADGKPRRTAYLRSGLATAGICFQLALAPVAAASGSGAPAPGAEPATVAQASQPSDADESPPPGPTTAPSEPAAPSEPTAPSEPAAPATEPTVPLCDEVVAGSEGPTRLRETAYGCGVGAEACAYEEVIFVVDPDGRVVHAKTTTGPLPNDDRQCILDALAGVCFPDAADTFVHDVLYGPCD